MMPMPNHRTGFTLVELMVVSVLMAVLAVLLSSAWVGVGRTAAGLIGRSQLVQERDFAVVALSRDLGGCSVEPDARLGEKINGRWLKWECPNNNLLTSNQDLVLYYDGGLKPDGVTVNGNTVVRYAVESGGLLKRKTWLKGGTTATIFTVAKNVYSMTVTPDPNDVKAVNIVLCFKYRTLTLTCDLTAKQPSKPPELPGPPFQTLPWWIDHYTSP